MDDVKKGVVLGGTRPQMGGLVPDNNFFGKWRQQPLKRFSFSVFSTVTKETPAKILRPYNTYKKSVMPPLFCPLVGWSVGWW